MPCTTQRDEICVGWHRIGFRLYHGAPSEPRGAPFIILYIYGGARLNEISTLLDLYIFQGSGYFSIAYPKSFKKQICCYFGMIILMIWNVIIFVLTRCWIYNHKYDKFDQRIRFFKLWTLHFQGRRRMSFCRLPLVCSKLEKLGIRHLFSSYLTFSFLVSALETRMEKTTPLKFHWLLGCRSDGDKLGNLEGQDHF